MIDILALCGLAFALVLAMAIMFGQSERRRGASNALINISKKYSGSLARFISATRRKVPSGSRLTDLWVRRMSDDE